MAEEIKKEYYNNGNIKIKKYYLNGKLHRDNGPAYIWYNIDGNIREKIYYLNSKIHRDNGPSIISYYENGNIEEEWYYLNGDFNKINGPVSINYTENGEIGLKVYWINDNEVTEIYNEVKEILEELYIKYPNMDDMEMIFKLQYDSLYYQVFQLIKEEKGHD